MINKPQPFSLKQRMSSNDGKVPSFESSVVRSNAFPYQRLDPQANQAIGFNNHNKTVKALPQRELSHLEQRIRHQFNQQLPIHNGLQISNFAKPALKNGCSHQVDQLLLSESRRPIDTIKAQIEKAYELTEKVIYDEGEEESYAFYTEDGSIGGDNGFLDIQTSYENKLFKVENSKRSNYIGPHASDACIAQLACLESHGEIQLPKSLPTTILWGPITNKETIAATDIILKQRPSNDDGNVNLRLDRENPNNPSNEIIHFLLTETVNGKATAYTINDFNNLTNSKQIIESVDIQAQPYSIGFNIGILNEAK